MKILAIAPLLFLMSVCSFAQKYSTADLIGKWEGKDSEGSVGGLEFREESPGLVRFTIKDVTHTCKYVVDFSKEPIWFDLVLKMANGTQKTMVGLLEVVDHSTLKWKISKSNNRFSNYVKDKNQDFMHLHRNE